ncbi:phenylalanine--tRNA ligase subunit beta [Campylobacter sp. RM12640]|uniref:phenylalanine--tRNA ligase subunit beta n=1 Tax=unclassified Campylobacter TaxID=2593542 RepID=UPI003014CADC|nr:phenylalanine--tRNA ligase subunit beta [Campylobacter sp. RM12640]MBZ7988851.1 phenylalanine--tRNA ligase subunit beta [Campylobacter sp. RM12635]
MIISKNWLNEFIDLKNISTDELVKTLNSIGLEVDGVTTIIAPKKVVVAKVMSKEKHPDAEKLSICQVDVGNEVLQIVCGAKNVEAGQFVAVSLEGAQIGDITIKRAKLRGVESNGMICSSTELGFAKINDGIMVLDNSIGELTLGKELCEYPLFNDELIEIELTPNRGDCLSINGIARDLSAALDINLKEKKPFKDVDNAEGIRRILNVHFSDGIDGNLNIKAIELLNNIENTLKVKLRLASIEELKDNAIENLLSYTTHASGVLFNAVDLSKLCNECEQISLDVKTKENKEFVIKYKDKELAIAGITQNEEFKIDKDSKKIIIIANYVNPKIIANTHKNYKNTDIYRSFRGSEPELNIGIDYLFNLLQLNKNIKIYGSSCQNTPSKEKISINCNISELENMIGQSCEKNDVVKILKRLGFELSIAEDNLYLKVPFYRHDINNSADICEEIVRMIGIDNIKPKPLDFYELNRTNNTYLKYKKSLELRNRALMCGYFESIGYVFDSKEFLEKLNLKYIKNEIINPITNEMNTLRSSIISTLLKQASFNFNNSRKSVKLFEIGSVFDENGQENKKFALISSGLSENANLKNHAKPKNVDFFTFLNELKTILKDFQLKSSDYHLFSEFERADIYKNNQKIGVVGRLDLHLENELELPVTYLCEIDFNALEYDFIQAKAYSKFQGTTRDLSILVPKNYDYSVIKSTINKLNIKNLKDFKIVDLYQDESLKDYESLSISFSFVDDEKVLKNDDINNEMNEIISELDKIGLKLR